MIFLSLVLVIVAAVTLVLGVFQDGLVLIYVSIATCVAAMAVLGAGVLLRRREEATAGPAGYGDASTIRTGGAAVARTPVAVTDDRREAATDAEEVDEQRTAVVRKVEATPTVGDDDAAFRRPAAADPAGTADVPTPAAGDAAAAAAAGAGVATGAAARAEDEQEPVRPVAKRAVVKRTRTAAAPITPTAASEPAATDTAEVEAAPTPVAQVKKATAKKATAKKATAKKATAKKATAKKATAKKATAKKATAKKATAKKATAKKATAKKATAKEATASGRSVSDLAGVRGLGPAKRDKLVARFGSIDAVAAASVEDLTAVPGIGEGTARAIKDALR